MPYIEGAQDRENLAPCSVRPARTPGELNYQLTCLVAAYYIINGGRYQQINDIVGALECAKAEFYRRIAAPYEDRKKVANGDVY